jgi:peptide/nickel transport system substrate-binding protein
MFKFKEFTRGEKIVFGRNEDYWGDKADWATVTFRPITSDGPRVAALLAGDVDLIDNPPLQDLERIKSEGFQVAQGLSNRVIYLHLDQHGEDTPGITGTDGKNPLLDKRVRKALSMAINRDAIVERIMNGVAVPAGELLPPGMFGTTPGAEAEKYDPDGAKKLLAEAGYPNGFGLTIGSPNDRYINDAQVSQAIAQMFTRIGIQTQVDAVTASTFFKRRNQFEFSVYLAGWGAATGEMSSPLRALVATKDKDKGYGGTNAGRYSNPALDALIDKALATVDDDKREALLQEASQVVVQDYGILPLHYEVTPWAFRKGIDFKPRVDQYTLALGVKPAS